MPTTPKSDAFATWLQDIGPVVDQALAEELKRMDPGAMSEALHQALHYSLLGPGKRVRPALCLLACEAHGGRRENALAAGVALEAIHAYSLVHDDLPCMDDDALRRGRPTVHVAFDEASAVLAGDALQAFAFQVLSAQEQTPNALAQVACLAQASGANGMVGGQALDMEAEGAEVTFQAVLDLHRGKTGALLEASLELGALAAGVPSQTAQAWQDFGHAVGLLFQATDDLLDATASSEVLGKTAGKDHAVGKATLAAVLGLTGLNELIAEEVRRAESALSALELSPSPAQEALAALPSFLACRTR